MDETLHVFRNSNVNVNETNVLLKKAGDPKYYIIAITSLVIFLLISIITTVLLCVTLKNEPILWSAEVDKPPERSSGRIDEETSEAVIEDEHSL